MVLAREQGVRPSTPALFNAARYLKLKVEHHIIPQTQNDFESVGPVRGSPERLMMSVKLLLILAMGAAGIATDTVDEALANEQEGK